MAVYVDVLKDAWKDVHAGIIVKGKQMWVVPRTLLEVKTLKSRLKDAWLVFTNQADAVIYHKGDEE